MKITILFTLLALSFTTLQGQDEGSRSEDENPFDAYLKLAPKAAEVSAALNASEKRDGLFVGSLVNNSVFRGMKPEMKPRVDSEIDLVG